MKNHPASGIFLVVLLIVFIPEPCNAIQDIIPVCARSQGLGGASVILTGPHAGLHNQAGLASTENLTVILHGENHFLTPETGLGAFAVCVPVHSGAFGFHYTCYGSRYYNESKFVLAYGRKIGKKIHAGIEMDYVRIHQAAGYGDLHALIPGIGIQFFPFKKLVLGFQIYNPAQQHLSKSADEEIPALIQAGAGYDVDGELLLCFEIAKRNHQDMIYRAGLEYYIFDKLCIRTGIELDEYPQAAFGLGYKIKTMDIDIGIKSHGVLGFSPSVSLTWYFNAL